MYFVAFPVPSKHRRVMAGVVFLYFLAGKFTDIVGDSAQLYLNRDVNYHTLYTRTGWDEACPSSCPPTICLANPTDLPVLNALSVAHGP